MDKIRDSIHKDIVISDEELHIIDDSIFQRLRYIRQNGMAYLLYPSANHTRFEHSIGTMHVAGNIAKQLGTADINLVRIVALLHDLGHPPFSHALEINGYNHEKYTVKKMKKIPYENYTAKDIISTYQSNNLIESSIVHADLDADRLDYLVRDSHHTGVGYGSIDIQSIISSMKTYGSKIAIDYMNKIPAESLLVARSQMYPAVYMHRITRAADLMMKYAVDKAISEKILKMSDLAKLDESQLWGILLPVIHSLENKKMESYRMATLLKNRQLYLPHIVLGYSDLTAVERWKLINLTLPEKRHIENRFYEKYGAKIFVDVPDIPKLEDHSIPVEKDGKIYNLDDVSPITDGLKNTYLASWNTLILGHPDLKHELYDFQRNYFFNSISYRPEDCEVYATLLSNGKMCGKEQLFNRIKETYTISDMDIIKQIKKLIFCGLIRKTTIPIGGVFRYDYSIIENSI